MKKNLTINENISIEDAVKQLDITAGRLLLVVDDNERLLGLFQAGMYGEHSFQGKV